MKVISSGPTFCVSGAVVLTKEEVEAILHALRTGRDVEAKANTPARRGITSYGPLTFSELETLVKSLEDYQKERRWV